MHGESISARVEREHELGQLRTSLQESKENYLAAVREHSDELRKLLDQRKQVVEQLRSIGELLDNGNVAAAKAALSRQADTLQRQGLEELVDALEVVKANGDLAPELERVLDGTKAKLASLIRQEHSGGATAA